MRQRLYPFKTKRKRFDWWERLPIITSLLSSVIIAGIGLYISYSVQRNQNAIQRTQVDITRNQLAITESNNAAQLAITTHRNETDQRLAELKMASDLLEPLVSKDERKREAATLMLPRALTDTVMC